VKQMTRKKKTAGTVGRTVRPTRAYTRGFTPHGDGVEFKVRRIPSTFWKQVQAKAKREGVSVRGMFLTTMQQFLEQ